VEIEQQERGRLTELRFTIGFDPAQVTVTDTPFGAVIEIDGARSDGTPGAPDLPIAIFDVALPPRAAVREVSVEADRTAPLEGVSFIAPRQPAAPGERRCSPLERLRDDGLVVAWPRPPFVPPVPELYVEATRAEVARLAAVDETGIQPIATVLVRPVTLTSDGDVVLHTSLEIVLVVDEVSTDERPSPVSFSSKAQAERWKELAKSRVVNPSAVIELGDIIGRYLGGAEYLIITDNQRWDASTAHPLDPLDGDLVAEFERLAAWKRVKGMTARVVTVTDIVNGRYGQFAGFCRRDLQETIREFVKWAHAHWGTAWLLLGGDVSVIPPRTIVGYVGGFSPAATDPPDPGGSHWTGTYLKVHASPAADTPLLRSADGHRIPYDATGSSSGSQAGWYFTDASYTTRSTTPTEYVRVNGPAAQVNVELFWLTNDNTIPTDLYYADVVGYPARSANGTWVEVGGAGRLPARLVRLCGGHDWDQINNGLYGQWNAGADLDGVRYVADLSVGRAPVDSAVQARTFVDKVLAYEQQSGWFATTAWLRKLLMVSSNWGGRTGYWPAAVLTDDHYTKLSTADHAVIQLSAAPSTNVELLTHVTDDDERRLPFRLDAGPGKRGWYYAVSGTSTTPSVFIVNLPWSTPVEFPLPSRWIVAYGTPDEMAPQFFVLDDSAADGSMLDQESLRTQLQTDVPDWSDVARLYEDDVDLSPAAMTAAPLAHLSADRLEADLDAGPHVVSLSGHGYWGGCCGLSPSMRTSLTNGHHTFIGYADSCLTNQFDVEDAISELLVENENGGAVAYEGNTRFSWIGVGDDFQRNFFKGLPATRALGLLHDRRLAMLGANTGFWPVYNRWTIFSLNLIGDPEMRIWTFPPWRLCLDLPSKVHLGRTLSVQVLHNDRPLPGATVAIQQGSLVRVEDTDGGGTATFELSDMATGALQVTAVHPRASALTTTIQVGGLLWCEAEVLRVRVLIEHAEVVLHADDGERTAVVREGRADLMAVLGAAVGTGRTLHVLIDDDGIIEAAEIGTPSMVGQNGSQAQLGERIPHDGSRVD
jgi:hypothetical protein